MAQVILTLARDNRTNDVRKAVEAGLSPVDFANQIGQTALHIAALHGNVETIEVLIELGIDVNIQNSRGHTALHFAAGAKARAKETCEALIKGGADPFVEDGFGSLAYERIEGDEELRTLLGAPDPKLFEYAAKGQVEELKALLDDSPPITCQMSNDDKKTPMHLAAAAGQIKIVELLLERGVEADNMDASGSTALHDAVREGHAEVVARLLKAGASANAQNMRLNNYTSGEWLSKESKETLEPFDQTPLHLAIEDGDPELIQMLLGAGCDMNQEDFDGNTPFHLALEENDKEVLELLLSKGTADLSKGSSDYHTPLHYLASRGRAPLISRLAALGADVDSANAEGWTPLHLAARGSKVDAVIALIDAGCDAAKVNGVGDTALHLAAINGRKEICELLKQRSPELLEAKNEEGQTPSEAATKPDIKAILEP